MFVVVVTVFVMDCVTERRPFELHPVQFGLIFALVFAVAGTALLVAATTIRKRYLS